MFQSLPVDLDGKGLLLITKLGVKSLNKARGQSTDSTGQIINSFSSRVDKQAEKIKERGQYQPLLYG